MILRRLISLCMLGIALYGCRTSTLEAEDSFVGYNYFPLQPGLTNTYAVRTVNYPLLGDSSVANFEIKTVIGEAFDNLRGGQSFYFSRYVKAEGASDFVLDSVFTIERTATLAIIRQSNIDQIKLTFPIRLGAEFNPNQLNNRPQNNQRPARITGVRGTLSVLNTSFNDVVEVSIREDVNLREEKTIVEWYAPNVGLIKQEISNLDFDNDGNTAAIFGTRYRATLLSSRVE